MKFALNISCRTENINEISTSDNFYWCLKLKCLQCNEVDNNWHRINENAQVFTKGRHGFNFSIKCKVCSSVSTVDIVPNSVKFLKTDLRDMIEKQAVVVFDCRGVEPFQFDPDDGWEAKCEDSGSVFRDISFEDGGDWANYDERGNFPVLIEDFKGEFMRI